MPHLPVSEASPPWSCDVLPDYENCGIINRTLVWRMHGVVAERHDCHMVKNKNINITPDSTGAPTRRCGHLPGRLWDS